MGAHERRSFEIGVSDHAAGQLLPLILASLHRKKPHTQLLVTVGTSGELFAAYERGRFDAVIGRCDDVGADGQIVLVDKLAGLGRRHLVGTHVIRFPSSRWLPPAVFAILPCSCLALTGSPGGVCSLAWA